MFFALFFQSGEKYADEHFWDFWIGAVLRIIFSAADITGLDIFKI